MKRLAILEDRKKEIIGEIRRSDESKYDHRPHGVLLVANGLSPYRVSEFMGDSPKSVENWVNSFLKDGFGSLREPRRPGRPTRLSDIMDSIPLDLRKNPHGPGVFTEPLGQETPQPPPEPQVQCRPGHKAVPADIQETRVQVEETQAEDSKG